MRTELLTALTTGLSGNAIGISQELPWTAGNEPLYIKNMRKIYLAPEQRVDETVIPVLNANDVKRTITTVRGYLAIDAKNQPTNFAQALNAIKAVRDAQVFDGYYERFVDYTTEISGDVTIYTIEYRFTSIE